MMSSDGQPAPRGQVLIIVAFGMVVLMGIGAIVIDLGLSWMLRRHEQNAADPASIAAAAYIEDGDTPGTRANMRVAACFYARENGFFSGNAACDDEPDGTALRVHWPPAYGPFAGNWGMVQVEITDVHPSFFGGVFGRDVAVVRSNAVAAREQTSANSNSLVALSPDDCGAGRTHGNGTVTIEPAINPDTGSEYNGGYVHVNSTCNNGTFDNACGNGSGGFKQGGNAGTRIIAPMIYVNGTCEQAGGVVASPVTEGAGVTPDPMWGLHGPRQEDWPAGHCPKKQGNQIVYVVSQPGDNPCELPSTNVTYTLTPGVYYGGWNFTKKDTTVRLLPGIYIIAGGGLKTTQGTIDSTPEAIGGDPDPSADPARVLIFSTDNTVDPSCADDVAIARSGGSAYEARCVQGPIKMSGKGSFRMWGLAADSGPFCDSSIAGNCPWRGLLMWQDWRSSNPTAGANACGSLPPCIDLAGQGVLDLAGTIYAPLADVKITGNGDLEGTRLAIQIISYTWDIGGNGNLYMPYDPNDLYHFLQQGLVH